MLPRETALILHLQPHHTPAVLLVFGDALSAPRASHHGIAAWIAELVLPHLPVGPADEAPRNNRRIHRNASQLRPRKRLASSESSGSWVKSRSPSSSEQPSQT